MKPFDLQKALAGEPVVTRDGRKIIELHFFEKFKLDRPIFAVIEGWHYVTTFFIDGTFDRKETDKDLFMAPVKKTYWMNVYKEDLNNFQIRTYLYENESAAIFARCHNCIKTISFEVEL